MVTLPYEVRARRANRLGRIHHGAVSAVVNRRHGVATVLQQHGTTFTAVAYMVQAGRAPRAPGANVAVAYILYGTLLTASGVWADRNGRTAAAIGTLLVIGGVRCGTPMPGHGVPECQVGSPLSVCVDVCVLTVISNAAPQRSAKHFFFLSFTTLFPTYSNLVALLPWRWLAFLGYRALYRPRATRRTPASRSKTWRSCSPRPGRRSTSRSAGSPGAN